MMFEVRPKVDPVVQKMYESSMKDLEKFFGFRWDKYRPNIIVVKERKTIDKLFGMKTPGWVTGWCMGWYVYVLDRKNYSRESSHDYSEEHYSTLIKHELVHVFMKAVSGKDDESPHWLWEGLAVYLSGQNKFHKRPEAFSGFLKYYSSQEVGKGVYVESGFALELLIKKFGKKKLLSLVKLLGTANSEKEFKKLFRKVYRFDLTYKSFNGLI